MRPRWNRTVAACGKRFVSGPRRENAAAGLPLSKRRDGRRDLRLRVAGIELGGGVVLALRREPAAEPLKREPVQELRVRVAAWRRPSPSSSNWLRRRQPGERGPAARSSGTNSGSPGGKSGCRASSARWADGESGCADAASPPGRGRLLRRRPPRGSRSRGGAGRASRRGCSRRESLDVGEARSPARRRTRRRPGRRASRSARRSDRPRRAACCE